MGVVQVAEGDPDQVIAPHQTAPLEHDESEKTHAYTDEKNVPDIEVDSTGLDSELDDAAKIYVPDEDDEFIDPRLKDYPVPLVAKTVDLHNDFKYEILTRTVLVRSGRDSMLILS